MDTSRTPLHQDRAGAGAASGSGEPTRTKLVPPRTGRGDDPMLPRIGVMRALHRHRPKAASARRQKWAKAYRIVR